MLKVGDTLPSAPVLSTIDKTGAEQIHNTRDTIAKDLGWSTGKTAYGRKRGFYLLPYLLH
ncbi:MAG: hypothetical protein J5I50_12260 [Chitinophagaceae bacterium]|nr:hypothetical protein [Chitinophagaceae bacterium]